jgi:ABC-type phosphate transport system substrate-binding protein
MEKPVNYTIEQTRELVMKYAENPSADTVKFFAEKFGKTTKSIIAKLSREGVYQKKEYVNKNGVKPVQKDSVADAIGAILNLTEPEVSSLTKANKSALEKIFKALAESKPV